jgi:hypothetical protein
MRMSALAMTVSGLLAAAAFTSAPAMANHLWSAERGWQTGHYRAPTRVIVRPSGDRVIVRERPRARRVVVVHPDGSRTVRVIRRDRRPPVVVYR